MTADTGITEDERAAYRARTAAGGCRVFDCTTQAGEGFSIWWKCPDGHREEIRYCRKHGPEMLEVAATTAPQIRCECGGWARPMVEGLALY